MNKSPPVILHGEYRTDSVCVADKRYSPEGYFIDNPILTRTGIFEYNLPDGSVRRELRRPEDVFNSESLASYEGKPIIITHDAQEIDKKNIKRESVGCILTPGQQDGDTVRAKIILHDPDAVKASGLRELSLGYFQNLIMEQGTWQGRPYDAIQTNIRINHLALVSVARAGEEAHLNLDGKDRSNLEFDQQNGKQEQQGDETMNEKEKGEWVEKPNQDYMENTGDIDPEAFKTAMKAYLSALHSSTTSAATDSDDVETLNDDSEKDSTTEEDPQMGVEQLWKSDGERISEIAARRDAMEDGPIKDDINTLLELLEKATTSMMDGEGCEDKAPKMNHDGKGFQAAVNKRVELILMGKKLRLDGVERLSNDDLKRKIIATILPEVRLDGKDNRYVEAAYDLAKARANARKTVDDQRRQMFYRMDAKEDDTRNPDVARQRMIDAQKQSYKK